MEAQIFYWTGVVIWWAVSIAAISVMIVFAVIAPVYAFHRFKLNWWKWITAAKFIEIGYTPQELKKILRDAGVHDDDFLRKAKMVIDTAKKCNQQK